MTADDAVHLARGFMVAGMVVSVVMLVLALIVVGKGRN